MALRSGVQVPDGPKLARQGVAVDFGAAEQGPQRLAHHLAAEVRFGVARERPDHPRPAPQAQRTHQLVADGLKVKLLALHPANVAEVVVAKAQKAFHLSAAEVLQARLQVHMQVPGVVVVFHALRHVQVHAARSVGQVAQGVEAQQGVAVNRHAQQALHRLGQGLRAAAPVGGVDLARSVTGNGDPGVARDAQQLHLAARPELRQHDGIGEVGEFFGFGGPGPHCRPVVVFGRHACQQQVDRVIGRSGKSAVFQRRRNSGRKQGHQARQREQQQDTDNHRGSI